MEEKGFFCTLLIKVTYIVYTSHTQKILFTKCGCQLLKKRGNRLVVTRQTIGLRITISFGPKVQRLKVATILKECPHF